MQVYDDKTLADLWEGNLDHEKLRQIQARFKDRDRFERFVAYCRERISWDDRILLPLQPHLFIVERADGMRIIKCDCGREFGDHRENWKFEARIFVRDSDELMQEVYPPLMHCNPEWMELREYYCPGCYALLEVEMVPPGYPIIHDFRPDLESFYRDWLGKEL